MPPVHWDTIVTGLISAALFWGIHRLTALLKGYIDHSTEWRRKTDKRLDAIEEKQNRSIAQQAVDIRSDIIHKCHRYLDDLGKAGIEEKEALHDEHEQYAKFCEDLGMDNNFIDDLVQRVMDLPER